MVLPEGAPVQVHVPEKFPTSRECLAALDALDAVHEELTAEQWRMFKEAVQSCPWFRARQLEL
ncbi:MAG TPA: hypothetical protein VLK82_19900 [Candidatus Tectomicrobia bacterium]|nr:hypothetical protein [Candidatus Tectomicrobia bacterium]